jgi:hypothetical protein
MARSTSLVSLAEREQFMPGRVLIRRVGTLSNRLLKKLGGIWRSFTRQVSADVQPNESLTSFVFREGQIVRRTNAIHHSRLMPRRNHENRRLEVSVARSSKLTEAQVWTIFSAHFDPHSPKPAIGRGVGPASAVFAEMLVFDPDGEPYPEHANIIGWHDAPNKPDNELKHFWMAQAQKMATQFSYRPRAK